MNINLRNEPVKRNLLRKKQRGRYVFFGLTSIFIFITGAYVFLTYLDSEQTISTAYRYQQSVRYSPVNLDQIESSPSYVKSYLYNGMKNSVPGKDRFVQAMSDESSLTLWGHAAAPKQVGMPTEIKVLPIHEGHATNVLAKGWGTLNKSYKMGSGNNALGAYRFDSIDSQYKNKVYASPITDIEVGYRPKLYETNGIDVYTYELTERYNHVNLHGYDYRTLTEDVPQGESSVITLVSAEQDRWTRFYQSEYVVIIRGKLVNKKKLNASPNEIQDLFPRYESE